MDEQICIKQEECDIDDVKLEPEDLETDTTINDDINCGICIEEVKLETNAVYEENNVRFRNNQQLLLQTDKSLTNYSAKFPTIKQFYNRNDRDPKRFICNVCYEKFPNLRLLNDHKRAHEDSGQIEPKESKAGMCHVCGKMSNRINLHVKWHDKSIACDRCDFRCAHRTHLAEHMRVHTGERLNRCDLCSKRFQRKHDLARHKLAVHSKVRPFKCSVCNRGFAKNKSLISHKCL